MRTQGDFIVRPYLQIRLLELRPNFSLMDIVQSLPYPINAKHKARNFTSINFVSKKGKLVIFHDTCRAFKWSASNEHSNDQIFKWSAFRRQTFSHSDIFLFRGNLLSLHGILFPISRNGSFIFIFPTDRKAHTTSFDGPVVEHWLELKIAQIANGSTVQDR